MKAIHFQLLKEYLDEIIIHQGMITVSNPEKIIDKVRIDFLIKLAFHFYHKFHTKKDLVATKERHISLDKSGNWQSIVRLEKNATSSTDTQREMECINCGAEMPVPDSCIDNPICLICEDCLREIGSEMEIWVKLFD